MSAAELHDQDELAGEFLDEHMEHADERWLMSYADMMTLLMGLFVMLYSMYDQFPVIQESAGLKFSSSKEAKGAQEDPAVARQIEDNAIEKVKIENETLRVKVEAMETALTAEKAKVAEANAMMEVIKVKADTVVPTPNVQRLEKEISDLRSQLAQSKAELVNAQAAAERQQQRFSRNADNVPERDESRTDLRSDGLGGKGGGLPKKNVVDLEITLGDGRIVKARSRGLGPNGLQMDAPVDFGRGKNLTVKMTRDGRAVEVRARAMESDDGGASPRLRFVDFPNGDRGTYMEWLKDPRDN